jgi:transmembrane protein EpsG
MGVLWLNLGIVYVLSFFSRYFARPVLGVLPYVKPSKIFVLIVTSVLVAISGLRNTIGDTYFYMHSYDIFNDKLNQIGFKSDFGFNYYQYILRQISNDPQILIFTSALITNVLIIIVLYKYSRMFEISLYVYITSGLFMVSMNGLRQFLAASIIFAATKFIFEGNFIKFLLVVLFAATIHSTALVLIPTYFVVRRKAWTKMTLFVLLLGVLMAIAFDQFSSVMFSALSDTKYSVYSDVAAHGASLMRAIVAAIPLTIAFIGKDKLRELWPKSDYIVNLALLDLVFEILSTKNWIFNRLEIYFGLYQIILISWIIPLFVKKQRKVVYFLILGCYLYFFYYEEVVKLGLYYRSDFIHL